MVLGNPPVPGRPTVWMILGQGPTASAAGVGGGCLDFFHSYQSFLASLSLSLGNGPIWTEILSQKAVNPTKQPTNQLIQFESEKSHIVIR